MLGVVNLKSIRSALKIPFFCIAWEIDDCFNCPSSCHSHTQTLPTDCHQENETVLRFHCHMWLKQILTFLGNFRSTYTSWILCIDFFGPRKYFTVCTSFSKFGCCKMLLLIFPFSKAGINGDLHMAVFVCLLFLLTEHISREWLLQDDLTVEASVFH